MSEVTRLLEQLQRDPSASEKLLPLVYEELRGMARARMAGERADHTLQATALVHEAYLRLVGNGSDLGAFDCRAHFFTAAAESMRRILIDHARAKRALKHGGNRERVELDDGFAIMSPCDGLEDLIALDDALALLQRDDPDTANLVKLLYFAGLSLDEAADVLGTSRSGVHRQWTFARAWLHDAMTGGENG